MQSKPTDTDTDPAPTPAAVAPPSITQEIDERAIRDVMIQEVKTAGRPVRRKPKRPPVKMDWRPGETAWYLVGPATKGSSMTRVRIVKWNRAHTHMRIDGPGLSNVSVKPSQLHVQLS